MRTVDSDVVVIAVSIFIDLGINELWVAYNSGEHFCYIPVHEICAGLGPQKS